MDGIHEQINALKEDRISLQYQYEHNKQVYAILFPFFYNFH